MLTKEELYRLQDLASLTIEKSQEDVFLSKLKNIVKYLDLLNEIDIEGVKSFVYIDNNQSVSSDINNCEKSKKILSNVNHEIINNCVVVKSVLS